MGILYKQFIDNEEYKTIKGDGGNFIYEEMLQFITKVDDELLKKDILGEINTWLLIGRSSYFIMAVNLIGDLKLFSLQEKLEEIKKKILKKHIPDFPEYYVEYIDNAIKRMNN